MPNSIKKQIHKVINGKNPKYAFAFKSILTHEQAEVTVTDVEWNVSMHKYMKPIVKFNEVVIAGVKIKQATGFNGKGIEPKVISPQVIQSIFNKNAIILLLDSILLSYKKAIVICNELTSKHLSR